MGRAEIIPHTVEDLHGTLEEARRVELKYDHLIAGDDSHDETCLVGERFHNIGVCFDTFGLVRGKSNASASCPVCR